MNSYRILYNPRSGNGRGENVARRLDALWPDKLLTYVDITRIADKAAYLATIPEDEGIVLAGGDGTLGHFINDLDGRVPDREILYYAAGTGNDFLNDLERSGEDLPFRVNEYLQDLPMVKVNGMTKRFFNGVGFGIDGYCCEEADKIREKKSNKPVNYTVIVVKGFIYGYHRTKATVTVDGMTRHYEKVWLCPTMKGRYIGGGMKIAPDQDRLNPTKEVSLMVMRRKSKLKTLFLFPKVFNGNHVKHTDVVDVFKGHDIHVTFDRPTALQIDGETMIGVTEYRVTTGAQPSLATVAHAMATV